MRFPYRAVGDYHVDRPQVYRQKCQSRAVLIARRLLYRNVFLLRVFLSPPYAGNRDRDNSGGNSNGDPPLPIPNREVKPVHAYDTAIPSGKVGSRQLQKPSEHALEAFFFFTPPTQSAPLKGYAALRAGLRLINGRGVNSSIKLVCGAARLTTRHSLFLYLSFRSSGRSRLVRSIACSSSHLEIFSWSPLRRMSGTFQPLKSAGLV